MDPEGKEAEAVAVGSVVDRADVFLEFVTLANNQAIIRDNAFKIKFLIIKKMWRSEAVKVMRKCTRLISKFLIWMRFKETSLTTLTQFMTVKHNHFPPIPLSLGLLPYLRKEFRGGSS